MKVRILGCGTSTGVPKIGNEWGQCDPAEPRNARLRTSILVESAGERMLVDCGPDLRQQLLSAEVGRLDGVIVTHAHGDHCHGIDELRPVSAGDRRPGAASCARRRARRAEAPVRLCVRAVGLLSADRRGARDRRGAALRAMRVTRFVDQPHGGPTSLGMRFDEGERSVAYAVDFSDLTDEMAALYEGVDVWIADCLTRKPHPTHTHLDGVLGWARDLRVGQLYLVHMGNGLDYRTLGRPSCPTGRRRPMTGWRSR